MYIFLKIHNKNYRVANELPKTILYMYNLKQSNTILCFTAVQLITAVQFYRILTMAQLYRILKIVQFYLTLTTVFHVWNYSLFGLCPSSTV